MCPSITADLFMQKGREVIATQSLTHLVGEGGEWYPRRNMPAAIKNIFHLVLNTGYIYVEGGSERDVFKLKPVVTTGVGQWSSLIRVHDARRVSDDEAAEIRALRKQREDAPNVTDTPLPTWVRIATGAYRTDVGLLHRRDNQRLHVWVVPRTPSHDLDVAAHHPGKRYPRRFFTPSHSTGFGTMTLCTDNPRALRFKHGSKVNAVFCGGYMDLVIDDLSVQPTQPKPLEIVCFGPDLAMKELFPESTCQTDALSDARHRFRFISYLPWSAIQDIRPLNLVKVVSRSLDAPQCRVLSVENDSAVLSVISDRVSEANQLKVDIRDIRLDFALGDTVEVLRSPDTINPVWAEGMVMSCVEDELDIILKDDSVVSTLIL
jgi:hypothetical protein